MDGPRHELVTTSSSTDWLPSPDLARRMWESGIEIISVEELDAMDLGPRTDYLRLVHNWQVENGVVSGYYQLVRDWQARCKAVTDEISHELCLQPQWGTGPACLTHASISQIDPDGEEKRRKARNKARIAAAAEVAIAYVEDVLSDVNHERHPSSVRSKVAMDVLDRETSTSKKQETKTEVSGTVNVEVHEQSAWVQARINEMAASTVDDEIDAIEAELLPELPTAFNQDKDPDPDEEEDAA